MKMWIAKSKKGVLQLFTDKPFKDRHGRWLGKRDSICHFDYPEVTFENSPMEVELKLASNENN